LHWAADDAVRVDPTRRRCAGVARRLEAAVDEALADRDALRTAHVDAVAARVSDLAVVDRRVRSGGLDPQDVRFAVLPVEDEALEDDVRVADAGDVARLGDDRRAPLCRADPDRRGR